MDIQTYRKQIDELNKQILQLVNKRAAIALKIGQEKKTHNKPISDPTREQKILDHLKTLNQGPLSAAAIEYIFKAIIRENKALEFSIEHKDDNNQ